MFCALLMEMAKYSWNYRNLVFLDEVSFDNRGIIRKRGYAIKGKRLLFRGEYARLPRVSCLSFIGVDGLLDNFVTEGTFTRLKLLACCKQFALGGKPYIYPGDYSIWILDGASIHCDKNMITYLRSIGIIVIFLPAYSPFFNPIKVMFGLVKAKMKRHYQEGVTKAILEEFVTLIMSTFVGYDFTKIFNHCGYFFSGFHPDKALQSDNLKSMGFGGGGPADLYYS